MLATTQGRLATGKKVNSALDNPTNFFTAAGLDSRASDISNLLDSIGNGVQVLQAANTGITSLSKLVDTAKSIANQVLQQPSGYTSRATVSIAAPAGAGPLAVAGTAGDLTNGGTNSLDGETLVFKTASGTTTLTISNAAGAGNVNSIDGINTALAAAGVELTAEPQRQRLDRLHLDQQCRVPDDHCDGHLCRSAGRFLDLGGRVGYGNLRRGRRCGRRFGVQATRANLVSQYNQIISQITTTAQDASFNGINLLNGDLLKLVFNETGKSTSTINGVTFNPAGLGLASLTSGTDFIDNAATNSVLTKLNTASTTLRSQASAFGANLSIVQIRQDFNKNLINVLQTGSSALTLADTNEEAANSQALSTRQSIATSALSLANQSQQSVLQLLR